MSVLVSLLASFEYLCYGSKAIINYLILSVWGQSLDVRIMNRVISVSSFLTQSFLTYHTCFNSVGMRVGCYKH